MPGPKQIHRRACKEISANGKFEEEYLKVHGAQCAWCKWVSGIENLLKAIAIEEIVIFLINNIIAWQRVLTKALQVRAWMQTREKLLTVLTVTKEELKVFTYTG